MTWSRFYCVQLCDVLDKPDSTGVGRYVVMD